MTGGCVGRIGVTAEARPLAPITSGARVPRFSLGPLLFAALAVAMAPSEAAAQHVEPPRRPGIRAPLFRPARPFTGLAAGLVPDAEAFVRTPEITIRRTGSLPVLLIPALFADSREPTVTPQQLQLVLFDGPAPRGTVTE